MALQLSDRIRRARGKKRQEDVADAIGKSTSAYRNWEAGKNTPSDGDLMLLAQKTGVRFEWLKTGAEPIRPEMDNGQPEDVGAQTSADALVRVPLASVQASAGEGREPFSEEIAAYVSYDRDQLRRDLGADPEKLLVIPVVGDSMDPTLRAGERMLVLRYDGEPIFDGGVYVFYGRYRGVLVKRVRWKKDGSMQLTGDNPDGGDVITIEPGEEGDWRVIGRVVRVEKNL